MFRNPLLLTALCLTGAIALWGVVDTDSLEGFASTYVSQQFKSRAWFIMLVASLVTLTALTLALSRYGTVRLGADDERPEFSTVSWLTMLFAAGMGVGLLFFGATEPLTHHRVLADHLEPGQAANAAQSSALS